MLRLVASVLTMLWLLFGLLGCSFVSKGGHADVGLTLDGERRSVIEVDWSPMEVTVESDLLTAVVEGPLELIP